MPRTLRCAYREGDRQCRRNGTGNPPLCNAHRTALEEMRGPQSFAGTMGALFGKFMRGQPISNEDLSRVADQGAQWVRQRAARPERGAPQSAVDSVLHELIRRQRAASPPPPPPKAAKPDPRPVLGWKAGQAVTVEQVQRRRRELARKFHPDRAGPDQKKARELTAKLAKINDAADQLIAELEAHP